MTEEEKRETLGQSLPDLAFEFHHFRIYRRLLQESARHSHGRLCPALRQAVTYALLLHFRLLIDFFFEQQPIPIHDDLVAAHFSALSGFKLEFLKALEQKPPWFADVKKNLNKRLAHVTETRRREKAPRMKYYAGHFPEIDRLIVGFIGALPQQPRDTLNREIEKYERRDAACWCVGEPADPCLANR